MSRDPLDDLIDRELGVVMNAEPSPGFTARIRQHVPAAVPQGLWTVWVVAPAAALALLLLVVVTFRNAAVDTPVLQSTLRDIPLPERTSPGAVTQAAPLLDAPRDTVSVGDALRTPASARVARRTDSVPSEVLLSAVETAALRRLFASVGPARVQPWRPVALSVEIRALPPVAEVTVARLEIYQVIVDPVVVIASEQ